MNKVGCWKKRVGASGGASLLLVLGAAVVSVSWCSGGDFVAGADFSHLALFESRGVVYRDSGQVADGMALLKAHGLTCVRLRLFTSSAVQAQADPYNYVNNLDYTVPLAVRVKNAGLKFLLDFHYSDTWADPGHQRKPAAWTNLTFLELKDQIRQYSSNAIAAFKAAGAMPDYVQVGNEITGGLLWPDGRVGGAYDTSAQWSNLGQLLTNAIAGVRDAAGGQMPKIIIHIDRGGDWGGTQWFFERLTQQHVPFDIIGESYYPFWHGSPDDLRSCLTNAAAQYHLPVMVMETAFPWTNSTNIFGIPATTSGQVDFVATIAEIVKGVPGGKGMGVFWWGAEYQMSAGPGLAGFDSRSFFDSGGEALPVVDAMGELAEPARLMANRTDGVLALSWSLSGAGSALRVTTNLGPPVVWSAVSAAVQRTGTVYSVTLPVSSNASCFYRLQAN